MTTKHKILLNEIIFKILPEFQNNIVQDAILKITEKYPKSIDVENLIEYALSYCGGYNFVDEKFKDFDDSDNSDSKTGSVNIKTRRIEIIGVENKIGSLRITISNTLSTIEKISFLYIPKEYVSLVWNNCYGKNKHKKRLLITWKELSPKYLKSTRSGYFNKFEKFRLDSFESLAQMSDEKFYQLRPSMRLNTVLPVIDSDLLTKNPPNLQTSILYTAMDDLQQSLNFEDILPIYPYEKS